MSGPPAPASFQVLLRMMYSTFFVPKLVAHHSLSPLMAASSFLLLPSSLLLFSLLLLLLLLGSSLGVFTSSLGRSGLEGTTGQSLEVTLLSKNLSGRTYQV